MLQDFKSLSLYIRQWKQEKKRKIVFYSATKKVFHKVVKKKKRSYYDITTSSRVAAAAATVAAATTEEPRARESYFAFYLFLLESVAHQTPPMTLYPSFLPMIRTFFSNLLSWWKKFSEQRASLFLSSPNDDEHVRKLQEEDAKNKSLVRLHKIQSNRPFAVQNSGSMAFFSIDGRVSWYLPNASPNSFSRTRYKSRWTWKNFFQYPRNKNRQQM